MSAPSDEVILKRLPGGPEFPAVVKTLSGRRLEVEPSSPVVPSLPMGTLVEVASPSCLYFGEIKGCHDRLIVVGIEHAVDQNALARIAQFWHNQP